jgi:hypothetical protein
MVTRILVTRIEPHFGVRILVIIVMYPNETPIHHPASSRVVCVTVVGVTVSVSKLSTVADNPTTQSIIMPSMTPGL